MTKKEKALKLLEDLRSCLPKPLLDDINQAEQGVRFIIGYLCDHQTREVSAGDLAKEMNVSSARIAALLNKMSKQGLIERITSNNDARKTLVKLTAKGIEKGQNDFEELTEKACHLIDEVGEDNLQKFVEISRKMKEVMDENI